jgi:putative membrane protein insertion efficiency factor
MLSAALVCLIRLYQRLSRVLPGVCRFHPTCSEYMIQAVQTHGLLRGLRLGLWRILRCNPFCRAGDDPVPPRQSETNSLTE